MAMSVSTNLDQTAATFLADGLVLIEGVLSAAQVDAARAGVAWAMETQGGHKLIKQRTYEWHREHPIFVDLIAHPIVMGLCDRVLGPNHHIIAAQCSRNVKAGFYAPGADRLHNDAVFFPAPGRQVPGVPMDRYSFSAMWYVQHTPMEMGPTKLIRGSQLEPDKNYEEKDVPGLIAAGRWFDRAVSAGSLLVFNHRTWHRGEANNTDKPRDLITNAYALPAVDKVQLLTEQPDGSQRYVPPDELLRSASRELIELLALRA